MPCLYYAVTDVESMMEETKFLELLAKVHTRCDKMDDAMLALTKAHDMQIRYVLNQMCV